MALLLDDYTAALFMAAAAERARLRADAKRIALDALAVPAPRRSLLSFLSYVRGAMRVRN